MKKFALIALMALLASPIFAADPVSVNILLSVDAWVTLSSTTSGPVTIAFSGVPAAGDRTAGTSSAPVKFEINSNSSGTWSAVIASKSGSGLTDDKWVLLGSGNGMPPFDTTPQLRTGTYGTSTVTGLAFDVNVTIPHFYGPKAASNVGATVTVTITSLDPSADPGNS